MTQAAQFNDLGANKLFFKLTEALAKKDNSDQWVLTQAQRDLVRGVEKQTLIPPERQNYLAEIVSCIRGYKKETEELAVMVDTFKPLKITEDALKIADEAYYKSWLEH